MSIAKWLGAYVRMNERGGFCRYRPDSSRGNRGTAMNALICSQECRPEPQMAMQAFERCGYTLLAGAGPGSRISGSVEGTRLGSASFSEANLRVAKNTAAVHVGKRSSPGTSSAAKVGRKAQCHPRSLMRIAPTATSSAVSSGERPPSANKGIPTIWIASARMATNQALRCSGDLMVFKKPNLKNPRFMWPSR